MHFFSGHKVRIVPDRYRGISRKEGLTIDGMVGLSSIIRIHNKYNILKIVEDIINDPVVYSIFDVKFIARKDPYEKQIEILKSLDLRPATNVYLNFSLVNSLDILINALLARENHYYLNCWGGYVIYYGTSFVGSIQDIIDNKNDLLSEIPLDF